MNKKGIFFTIIVIATLSLFLITYTYYSSVNNRESVTKRIETMNNFIFSLEQDMSRKLYISGFRIIFLLEKRITENGKFINNVQNDFNEIFFKNSLNAILLSGDDYQLMIGANYSSIKKDLKDMGKKVNLDVTLTDPIVQVSQDDPWNVKVTMYVNLTVRDQGNLASWNKDWIISSYIPIENFEDPFYIIGTNKTVNKIQRTPFRNFIDTTTSSKANLTSHIQGSYYINNTRAPSFIKRLEGDFSADQNGIESIVNLEKLNTQGVFVYDKSCVDYVYFNPSNNPDKFLVPGAPSWFRIDEDLGEGPNDRLTLYEIRGIAIAA
jgi:hypothetical protein